MIQNSSSRPVRVAIFGATSGIAQAVARLYAQRGASLVLVARNEEALRDIAGDLRVRGATDVATLTADFAGCETLGVTTDAAWSAFGGIDVALVAFGLLPDQQLTEADAAAFTEAVRLNFESPALLSMLLAARMEQECSGTLAVITSVAGDRGRQSNYTYGSAKGGLQRFLEGLRHRLQRSSVRVIDIRPGLVSTAMTSHMAQKGPLWAKPDAVAKDIVSAIERKRAVVYTPRFWQLIMWVVRTTPRAIFHRSRL